MFNTKVLNDIKIRPVKLETTKTNVYGSDMLKNPYGTIALVSKTNTGKTTTLYNMLNHTIDPKRKTNVVIFCSTHEMDPTYDKIKELLERKKCIVFSHYHFIEDNENIIDHYLDIIQNPPEENDNGTFCLEEIKERRPQADGSGDRLIVKTIKKTIKEPAYLSAKWIFIFDDLGRETRRSEMNFVMRSRHFHIRTYICTQHLSNLHPTVRKQISTCLFFKSFSKDKLRVIYEDLDIEILFELFETIYKFATRDPYSFLVYDVNEQQFRKNFNTLIEFKEN